MRWAIALAVVGGMGCGGGGKGGAVDGQNMIGGEVGRVCDLGSVPANETVLSSPVLECDSRLCLQVAFSQPAMCTAECLDASDCAEAADTACTVGFTCAPVVSVGPFGCRNVCVCSDRVPITACP